MKSIHKKVLGILLLLFVVQFAGAVGNTVQNVNPADDVITASDTGAGYLSSRDILLVVIIIFAVIGLILVL